MTLEDILSRRNDLSTFVVHLTKKETETMRTSDLNRFSKINLLEVTNG
jgi:hypothetical protein